MKHYYGIERNGTIVHHFVSAVDRNRWVDETTGATRATTRHPQVALALQEERKGHGEHFLVKHFARECEVEERRLAAEEEIANAKKHFARVYGQAASHAA